MLLKKIWVLVVYLVYFGFENGLFNNKNFVLKKMNQIFIFSLPKYATKFLEMILMVTADHGPAVSGAHNTIVCARAGKDLVSCLASGLLTIVRERILSENFRMIYLFRVIDLVVHWMMLLNNLVQHMMLVYIQLILSIKHVKKENF